MKRLFSLLITLTMMLSSVPTNAAEGDIVDIAAGNDSFSILVEALTEANLVGALQGDGPFTVFAPTDDAFADLLAALDITADELLANPQLSDVLLYHVVSGKIMSTDLVDGAIVETLNGDDISIDLSDGVKINESNVISADIEATNGVIHVIDKVLVPPGFSIEPEEELPDIVEIAVGDDNFTTLVAALTEADLVGALQGDGPFTVFAPTNDAFSDLLAALDITAEELLANEQLSDVLLYHVVSGKIMSTDLVDGAIVATLNGDDIAIDLSDGVKINESTVVNADIEASNGVIHVIDKVLVPPGFTIEPEEELPDIVEIAVGDDNFTTLVAALTEADLVGALQGDGPFTVFAPTNDAFSDLLTALDITAEELLANEQLTDVLLYHVVSGKIMSTDLVDGAHVETLNGDDITIDLSEGVRINESTVINADIEASNGVIHVIDAVLVPPGFTIEEDEDDNRDDEDDDKDDDDEDDDRDDGEDEDDERDDGEDEDDDRDDGEDEDDDRDDGEDEDDDRDDGEDEDDDRDDSEDEDDDRDDSEDEDEDRDDAEDEDEDEDRDDDEDDEDEDADNEDDNNERRNNRWNNRWNNRRERFRDRLRDFLRDYRWR